MDQRCNLGAYGKYDKSSLKHRHNQHRGKGQSDSLTKKKKMGGVGESTKSGEMHGQISRKRGKERGEVGKFSTLSMLKLNCFTVENLFPKGQWINVYYFYHDNMSAQKCFK